MTMLLSDPRLLLVPVVDCGEPLVRLDDDFGPAGALVRSGLADRLDRARATLPGGLRLRVVEGHRSLADQEAIIARYAASLRARHPQLTASRLHHLTSRYVAPVAVAPHVAGAAVDLTLVGAAGEPVDLGCPLDATPEESGGRCYFGAADIGREARAHRDLLAAALERVGLVNYQTEWWHWSYGDRFWATVTGAPAAVYGPVEVAEVAA